MPAPRNIGSGAMRAVEEELREATEERRDIDRRAARERKDLDKRIERLRVARAALGGGTVAPKHAPRLTTPRIAAYLQENPKSRSTEIANALEAPRTNVQSLLSAGKKRGLFTEEDGLWDNRRETPKDDIGGVR